MNTSVSMGEAGTMSESSSRVSSLARTARSRPFSAHHSNPLREWICICVEACLGMSIFDTDFRRPRSWMRTASAPMSFRNLTKATASSSSEFNMDVFTVTCTLTPRSWAYPTAPSSSLSEKLPANARAPKLFPAR